MESFTEYKINITNNKDDILKAILFGYNKFGFNLNYGSDKGIDIKVIKNGNPIPYYTLLLESAYCPINVVSTTFKSLTKNQCSQILDHYQKPITSHDFTKTSIIVTLDELIGNGGHYILYKQYPINAETYLEIPILNYATLEIILQTNPIKIK